MSTNRNSTSNAGAHVPSVYLVDDDAAIRDAIAFLLDTVSIACQTFTSARHFLDAYDQRPGVLILDVRMPQMSGLELQEQLLSEGVTNLAIIFISGHGDIPMAVEAMKRGAVDFLPKPFRDQELLDRVQMALEECRDDQRRAGDVLDIRQRIESLTPREQQVMGMVAEGKANKVVALDLDISQRTVEIHRTHMMEKMGVRNLANLVRSLHQVGYFEN
ncbi:MAG: response regulator transcription factor [Lysobacterales bacterium]